MQFFLFLGALLWVVVTAVFVDVITSSDPDQTAFRHGRFEAGNGAHGYGSKLVTMLT